MKRLAVLATLLLAGCQQPAPADESNSTLAATPPEPARIPANFHGLWAENDSACDHLDEPSRLTVTGNSVRYPAFVLAVESVAQPAPNAFAVKGLSKQTKKPAEAHFSIDATGNVLTDEAGGGQVRVRCT